MDQVVPAYVAVPAALVSAAGGATTNFDGVASDRVPGNPLSDNHLNLFDETQPRQLSPSSDIYRMTLTERAAALSVPLEPIPTGVAPKLPELPDVRAVIFDVYGTLFISEAGDIGTTESGSHREAFVAALTQLDVTMHDRDIGSAISLFGTLNKEQRERARGRGIEYPEMDVVDIWTRIVVSLCEARRIELPNGVNRPDFIKRLALEYEMLSNRAWSMPGVVGTTAELKQRGMKLGVVSNAQFYSVLLPSSLGRDWDQLGFDSRLMTWSFEHDEVKPSRKLFEHQLGALEREHGIKPHEALFVGNDMLKDIYAADRMGMKTALFAGDKRSLRLHESDPRCSDLQPNVILTDLTQLLWVVGRGKQ